MSTKSVTIACRLPKSLADQIDELHCKYRVPKSFLIRFSLEALVDLEKQEKGLNLPISFETLDRKEDCK